VVGEETVVIMEIQEVQVEGVEELLLLVELETHHQHHHHKEILGVVQDHRQEEVVGVHLQ
jgi:hypothetical protein